MSSNTKEIDLQAVAGRIKLARQMAGLSTREFADRAGITLASVYNLEHGRHFPSAFALYAIASNMGVSTDWILGVKSAQCSQPAV